MVQGALLLAAGFSRRFGGIKLTAPLTENNTVFSQSLRRLMNVSDNIVVVTREELLAEGLLEPLSGIERESVRIICCADAHLGMGHSLAAGTRELAGTDACLVCLSDMPLVRTDTLDILARALHPERITVPVHAGQRGNPVGFGRRFYPLLMQCSGDTGARHIIRDHIGDIQEVPVDDDGIFRDIDTPQDLHTNR